MTWKYLVDQLMGVNPPIIRVAGKMVINIGIGGDTPTKVGKPRTSNFDLIVAHVLREAGSLSTPELHEEILLLREQISMESLFRLCKRMENRGQLVSSKQARTSGNGRGVNVWQQGGEWILFNRGLNRRWNCKECNTRRVARLANTR